MDLFLTFKEEEKVLAENQYLFNMTYGARALKPRK